MEDKEKKPLTEARKKSFNKYWSKFQQVKFYCEPELYEEMKKECSKSGESMAAFLKKAVRRELDTRSES